MWKKKREWSHPLLPHVSFFFSKSAFTTAVKANFVMTEVDNDEGRQRSSSQQQDAQRKKDELLEYVQRRRAAKAETRRGQSARIESHPSAADEKEGGRRISPDTTTTSTSMVQMDQEDDNFGVFDGDDVDAKEDDYFGVFDGDVDDAKEDDYFGVFDDYFGVFEGDDDDAKEDDYFGVFDGDDDEVAVAEEVVAVDKQSRRSGRERRTVVSVYDEAAAKKKSGNAGKKEGRTMTPVSSVGTVMLAEEATVSPVDNGVAQTLVAIIGDRSIRVEVVIGGLPLTQPVAEEDDSNIPGIRMTKSGKWVSSICRHVSLFADLIHSLYSPFLSCYVFLCIEI